MASIEVATKCQSSAGTDDAFYYTIIDSGYTCTTNEIDGPGDDFEQCETNYFSQSWILGMNYFRVYSLI